mgnify:CR=1 FL=1
MKTIIIVFKTVLFLGGLVAATAGAVILPAAMSTEGDSILPVIGLIVGGAFLCVAGAAEFIRYRARIRHDQYVTQIIQSRYE